MTEIRRLLKNVNPKAKVPKGFGLWSKPLMISWLRANQKKCGCRVPKTHRACAYCGYLGAGISICGRCRAAGIDGPVIRGTEARRCPAHKIIAKKAK